MNAEGVGSEGCESSDSEASSWSAEGEAVGDVNVVTGDADIV